jgi:hypothetical protein
MNRPTSEHLRTRFGVGETPDAQVHPEPPKMVTVEAKDVDAARSWSPVSPSIVIVYNDTHAVVVALLSSNQELDPSDSPRYQFFKNAAWAAGLEYVEPRPETGDGTK